MEGSNHDLPFLANTGDRHLLCSLLDFTRLEPGDTENEIHAFCEKANRLSSAITPPASLCVYPAFIASVRQRISGMPIAAVAGAFPGGLAPLSVKLAEVEAALNAGADEIDYCMDYVHFNTDNGHLLEQELFELRQCAGSHILKLIIESGKLTAAEVTLASQIALAQGIDFIKTSSGKVEPGARLEDTAVMLREIDSFSKNQGGRKGIKVSGGIRTMETAMIFLNQAKQVMGEEYIQKKYFRIGASALADALLNRLD